ncbi:NUDIX hydrolase [Azospirillum halopraeferens]|uniref:NUDIX hydrolase n=1 Tax=Azospirillum halopraeferens TaxID=34010 RepID=UPI000418C245|nr:NUDIX hydrolase [Azospirillum halopraeferens]
MRRKKPHRQYAALPFAIDDGLRVMLITSRETRRWIIPKGWAEKGVRPHEMAAREAFEEAGLRGTVAETPIGTYEYVKRLSLKRSVPCVVDVFPLHVEEELDDWPEKQERERRWMRPSQAALLVSEQGLIELLQRLRIGT